MATTRERLHELLDAIEDDNLGAAQAFLEFLATRRGELVLLQESAPAAPPLPRPGDTDDINAFLANATAPYRPIEDAPEDDEPVTAEDLEAIREGREAYARGEYVEDDELKQQMGW
jgi:ABC-type Fe3+ transport system substrate-binding protein